MKKIKAFTDEEVQVEVDLGGKTVQENVTDILILWDEVRVPNQTFDQRYAAFQNKLSEKWGVQASRTTTFFLLEAALTMVKKKKKTLSIEANLKSLESTLPDEQPQS